MMEDIFIPQSTPDDALVGPLHTVTYVTGYKNELDTILCQGYGMTASPWYRPAGNDIATLNAYFGFDTSDNWEACLYSMPGSGANAQIRVLHVSPDLLPVRPDYDGLYVGGATISCPMKDLRAHEKVMAELGVESTMGVKELEFTSPSGDTYTSAEIVYMAPDNVFLMGVTRPDIFVPVGPMDPKSGIGAPAYSARCVAETEATIEFFRNVMGYEIRRDVNFVVGEQSAIRLPEGTNERFIQGFAPGSQTGYVVLMDHGEVHKRSGVAELGVPYRGIGMWSFATKSVAQVYERAKNMECKILQQPTTLNSPFLGATTVMLIRDPDGFAIEVFEN